jgi:hypothetical protein
MSFIRVEQNGVEYYTINATGESGMSLNGLAGLCGVPDQAIVEVLQQIAARVTRSPSLKPFFDRNLYLPVNAESGAKILKSDACMAIIQYFAFDTLNPTPEAKSSFERFAYMGIAAAIQQRLSHKLGGHMNVRTPAGSIGIVTPTEIITVQQFGNWKTAIEEVVTRGLYFPEHRQRIHLFGSPNQDMQTIVEFCEFAEIDLTFEPLVLEEVEG